MVANAGIIFESAAITEGSKSWPESALPIAKVKYHPIQQGPFLNKALGEH